MVSPKKNEKLLASAGRMAGFLAGALDLDLSLELWDGTRIPLGSTVSDDLRLYVSAPGVVGALVRRPTLDRFIDLYANGLIGIKGGTVVDVGERLAGKRTHRGFKSIGKRRLAGALLPFLFVAAEKPDHGRAYQGDAGGEGRTAGDHKKFISFHYDVGNAFYQLFLDPEMQYTCAYFHDWNETLEQAQLNKMEMICRKLRLKPGERMLDVGCGWGGLACYAARTYGVSVYGVTLSQAQVDYANENIARLGLQDKVVIEYKDYIDATGSYDKIAAIGIGEHLGVANYPRYFTKMRSLLADGGLFLNHANTRPAKRVKRKFGMRPEQRALRKYIFPGAEPDNIGNTISVMESHGLEVRDVENWRDYYALTTRMWCERLTANKDKAIALVGPQTYHMWVAYLGGCSLAFTRNTINIFQTLAAKSGCGPAPLPPTRADLYR